MLTQRHYKRDWEWNHNGCVKTDSYAFTTCLHQLQISTFADSAKMWWLEITPPKITEGNKSILHVVFQPWWIASIYLDSWKLYIVKTKLTKMKLTCSPWRLSGVLAMRGWHANNCLRPVLGKNPRVSLAYQRQHFFLYRRNKTVNGVTAWQQAAQQRFHKDKGGLLWLNSYLTSTLFKSVLATFYDRKTSVCCLQHALLFVWFGIW